MSTLADRVRAPVPADRIRLLLSDHPLHPERRRAEDILPSGLSLVELLAERTPAQHRDQNNWVVSINGRRVRPEELAETLPGPGDLVVAHLVPGPPLIAFAIAYAAAFVASAGAAAVGATLTAGTLGAIASFATFAANAIFSLAVTYGVSALAQKAFAPDLPKNARVGSSAPFYSVQGARNQILPQGTIQQHYGAPRVIPDLLGPLQTMTDSVGKQTVRGLYCVGQGRYDLSEFRYGTQSLDFLNPSKLVIWNGENGDPIHQVLADFLFGSSEEPLNLELRVVSNGYSATPRVAGSPAIIRSTTEDATGFEITVVWPQGAYSVAPDSGNVYATRLRLEVSYRPTGSGDPWVFVQSAEDQKVYYNKPIQQKFVRSVSKTLSPPGQYDVRVQIRSDSNPNNFPNDRGGRSSDSQFGIYVADGVYLNLRSFRPGDPIDLDFAAENLTLFGVEAKASDLVQGQLDLISVKAQRLLQIYDTEASPAGWTSDYFSTNSPAWAAANEERDAGIPDDEIDGVEWARFHTFCEENDWTCDLTQTEEQTLEDSVRTITSCGQGAPVMRGSLFSVTWDEERDPTAAFGPMNARELQIDMPPSDIIHGFKVRFPEAISDGRLREINIYVDGYTEETAEIFETLDLLIGLSTEAQVREHVRLLYLKRRARSAIYTFVAPIQANFCTQGEVALLAYGGALMGERHCQTRVTSYSTKNAGADIDEIFVSPAIRVEAGREYVLKVQRRSPGTGGNGFLVTTYPIVNPLTAGVQKLSALEVDGDVEIPTYTDDDNNVLPDSLEGAFAFGGETVATEVVILGVEPLEDRSCRIMAVEYARELVFGS